MADGKNTALQAYKNWLQGCKGMATKPLTQDQEAKLGKVRVQVWHDGDNKVARLVDHYALAFDPNAQPPKCDFSVSHTSNLTILISEGKYASEGLARVYRIDLDKRTGTVQTVPYASPNREPLPPPDWTELASQGLSKAGEGSFHGEPCLVVADKLSQTTDCVWSGGARDGYSAAIGEQFPKFNGTPTFWRKSSNGGDGFTTSQFMVGKLPNTSIFDIPAGIKIVDEGGP